MKSFPLCSWKKNRTRLKKPEVYPWITASFLDGAAVKQADLYVMGRLLLTGEMFDSSAWVLACKKKKKNSSCKTMLLVLWSRCISVYRQKESGLSEPQNVLYKRKILMVIVTLWFHAETLTCLQFAIKMRSCHRADKKWSKQRIY